MPAIKGVPKLINQAKNATPSTLLGGLSTNKIVGYNNTSVENCKKCAWGIGNGTKGGGYQGCCYYDYTGKHRPHEETGGENCEVFRPKKRGQRKKGL